MKTIVVGAGGLVGGELVRHLSTDHEVVAFRHAELDITNGELVNRAILRERPALILNCAVVGVDISELDPSSAWAVNAAGAENLAKAASAVDASLVQFSSNYVFDGKRPADSFYTIDDQPSPINTYGKTKLAGERAVISANQRSFIVRTSWVFGASKNNFLSSAPRCLRSAQKIRAINDVWASSTYVRDLVKRVMEIVTLGRYDTYHVVNSGRCSYYEFALEAARMQGISESQFSKLIEPVELRNLQLPASRPYYSPMSCRVSSELGLAPLRDWRSVLAEYIRDIA